MIDPKPLNWKAKPGVGLNIVRPRGWRDDTHIQRFIRDHHPSMA